MRFFSRTGASHFLALITLAIYCCCCCCPATLAGARQQEDHNKEEKKQAERAERERLRRPAEIQVNAEAEAVTARIVQTMRGYGYQISEEGRFRLVFTQEAGGFRGALVSGLTGAQGPPLRVVAFTVSQLGETTTVSVDLSVQLLKPFGRVDRVDKNKDKRWRREVEAFLLQLKNEAELSR